MEYKKNPQSPWKILNKYNNYLFLLTKKMLQ